MSVNPLVPMIGLSLVEAAKAAMHIYIALMAMSGKSTEEMDKMYAAGKEQFLDRHPSNLKDV